MIRDINVSYIQFNVIYFHILFNKFSKFFTVTQFTFYMEHLSRKNISVICLVIHFEHGE